MYYTPHCRWEFELKTTSEMGLLLYTAGQASHADYLGIELHENKIRLLMNKGNGATELIHSAIVSNGEWHKIIIDFNQNITGITVDDQSERLNLPTGGNRYLDLAETLYIGGTELNKRARAIGKGIKSGDRSYKGCLRNMVLDSSSIGLPDVKVSQGIVSGCVWTYQCLEKHPCIESAICSQLGVESFECTCDQPHCVNSNYVESTTVSFIIITTKQTSLSLIYIYNNNNIIGDTLFYNRNLLDNFFESNSFGQWI